MALAKAQESIALRITLFPHRFQGGIPICIAHAKTALDRRAGSVGRARIADHRIARTGPASMLACMSVAMPEQIEKSHSSSFGRAAQLSRLSFTQSVEVQRVGAAVPCALGDTRLVKWKASADRTQGPPSWVSTYSRSTAISPRCPPRPVVNSTRDSDQSLTIEWNLSSDSVRSEPNRRDPVSSECARMARFFCSIVRFDLGLPAAGEPRGSCFRAPPSSAAHRSQSLHR